MNEDWRDKVGFACQTLFGLYFRIFGGCNISRARAASLRFIMSVRIPITVRSASIISNIVWENGYLLDRIMNALRKALSMMQNHSNDT